VSPPPTAGAAAKKSTKEGAPEEDDKMDEFLSAMTSRGQAKSWNNDANGKRC
jgi:hypothetical protein